MKENTVYIRGLTSSTRAIFSRMEFVPQSMPATVTDVANCSLFFAILQTELLEDSLRDDQRPGTICSDVDIFKCPTDEAADIFRELWAA